MLETKLESLPTQIKQFELAYLKIGVGSIN